jgi:hypothetical protein
MTFRAADLPQLTVCHGIINLKGNTWMKMKCLLKFQFDIHQVLPNPKEASEFSTF